MVIIAFQIKDRYFKNINLENELEHISLSELTTLIGEAIAVHTAPSYWIVAELVELRENYSGHCYLSLAEKAGDKILAQCKASIWKPTYRMLRPYFESATGQAFASGISVKVKVAVNFHNVYGLNLTVQDIDPAFTVGELTVRRQQILQLLENDGVLDMNKVLEMPLAPQRIAIISSPTAAGYEDFVKQLKQNGYGYRFVTQLFSAIMQGEGAEASIVAAMEQIFDQVDKFDVVVVIRGGGSALDLSCFDNYNIALNLTQMPVPVLVGIGHERDETVLDLVAHTALKTPTAVAAYLIQLVQEVDVHVDELIERLQTAVHQIVVRQNQYLYSKTSGLPALISQLLSEKRLTLQQQAFRMSQMSKNFMNLYESTLRLYSRRLQLGIHDVINTHYKRLEKAEVVAIMSDPKALLKKGYSLSVKDGKILKSVKDIMPRDRFITYLYDGEFTSEVRSDPS